METARHDAPLPSPSAARPAPGARRVSSVAHTIRECERSLKRSRARRAAEREREARALLPRRWRALLALFGEAALVFGGAGAFLYALATWA
jgi:tRNA C32,U32 (ribose-2'-O)-methylase TrmJ